MAFDISRLIPFRFLSISEKSIPELLVDNIIKGYGTRENPYEIYDMEKVPDVLFFQGVFSYFKVSNGNFNRIGITRCQNINVSYCKIISLELNFCSKLSFTNNAIQVISLKKSKGNTFQYNKLSYQAEKGLQRKQLFFPLELFLQFVLFTIGIGIANFILFFFILYLWYPIGAWLFFLFFFIMLTCFWIIFARRFLKQLWFYLKSSREKNVISENEILK